MCVSVCKISPIFADKSELKTSNIRAARDRERERERQRPELKSEQGRECGFNLLDTLSFRLAQEVES